MTAEKAPFSSRPRRLLVVSTSLMTGGAEAMLGKLLPMLMKKGWHIEVLSLRRGGEWEVFLQESGISVRTLALSPGKISPAALWRMRHIVNSFAPDVVLGWMYHGNLAAAVASLFYRKARLFLGIRQSLDNIAYEKWHTRLAIRLHRIAAFRACAILYNSAHGMDTHLPMIGHAAISHVIPNGFLLDRFYRSEAEGVAVRAELSISENDSVILMPGRFDSAKDWPVFFAAAVRLAAVRRNVVFMACGIGMEDGNQSIAAMIPETIRGSVQLLGVRSDMRSLYNAADLVTLSSRTEGFPNVIGEAMACERLCVGTAVGDVSAVIGDAGMTVPPGDSQALAMAWDNCLNRNPEERAELGRRARRHIETHYSIGSVTEAFDNLLQKGAA